MILGIGTDIVQVARVAHSLERFGVRFARRILTEREWREFTAAPQPAHFLARRFAAKEAAGKALGTGFRDGLQLRHIGVDHDALGRPVLEFLEHAAVLRRSRGVGEAHVSISDEREYAVAFVILLRAE